MLLDSLFIRRVGFILLFFQVILVLSLATVFDLMLCGMHLFTLLRGESVGVLLLIRHFWANLLYSLGNCPIHSYWLDGLGKLLLDLLFLWIVAVRVILLLEIDLAF